MPWRNLDRARAPMPLASGRTVSAFAVLQAVHAACAARRWPRPRQMHPKHAVAAAAGFASVKEAAEAAAVAAAVAVVVAAVVAAAVVAVAAVVAGVAAGARGRDAAC